MPEDISIIYNKYWADPKRKKNLPIWLVILVLSGVIFLLAFIRFIPWVGEQLAKNALGLFLIFLPITIAAIIVGLLRGNKNYHSGIMRVLADRIEILYYPHPEDPLVTDVVFPKEKVQEIYLKTFTGGSRPKRSGMNISVEVIRNQELPFRCSVMRKDGTLFPWNNWGKRGDRYKYGLYTLRKHFGEQGYQIGGVWSTKVVLENKNVA